MNSLNVDEMILHRRIPPILKLLLRESVRAFNKLDSSQQQSTTMMANAARLVITNRLRRLQSLRFTELVGEAFKKSGKGGSSSGGGGNNWSRGGARGLLLSPVAALSGLFTWDEYKISDDDIRREVDEILSMFTMEKRAASEDEAHKKRIHIDLDKSRGYEDAEWKLIYDKPDLIIWRREIVLNENDLASHKAEGQSSAVGGGVNYDIYEYKVLGRIHDATPIEFYKTQVDLSVRKSWDYLVLYLDVMSKHVETHTELIRWIMHFPYPLYPREYIFVRRYCLDPDEGLLIQVSRAIPECEIRLTDDDHKSKSSSGKLN